MIYICLVTENVIIFVSYIIYYSFVVTVVVYEGSGV